MSLDKKVGKQLRKIATGWRFQEDSKSKFKTVDTALVNKNSNTE